MRARAYLRIRAGSFLRASGGFLVLKAEDVLADEEAWHRLKRALQDNRADIQSRDGPLGPGGWLKPEAPRADVKVIMIGGESSYDILYQADPDFQKLFKVHAEFDSSMPMDDSALMRLRGLRAAGLRRRGPPAPRLGRPRRRHRAGRAARRVPEPALRPDSA